jgi:hypothetical protein
MPTGKTINSNTYNQDSDRTQEAFQTSSSTQKSNRNLAAI